MNTNNNMFAKNGNMFNNQNTQPANQGFMSNNNTNTSMFNNNSTPQNNLFNQGATQGNNNPFGSNNSNTPMFGGGGMNSAGNNGPFGNNNMFSNNNNTSNNTPMFNNNSNNSMFNTGNNMFSQPNNAMNTATGSNNLFNSTLNRGSTTQTGSTQIVPSTGNPIINDSIQFQNSLEYTKLQLEECIRRLNAKNLQNIHLDNWNIYKDRPLNKLPYKEGVLRILYNFQQLQKTLKNLKQSNASIETKLTTFSKQTHKKLTLYKQCLLQTVSHNKLIEQVSTELDMMNKQIEDYFKPLYNAYKTKKKISIKEPNQFDLKISYDVLNKLEILNQRVDDMIACEMPADQEEVQSTIAVFQQLVQYYQNVSCSFKEFSSRYNQLKRSAIEKDRRGSYETVMSKIVSKVEQNFKKQFKYYDLIKEIDEILNQKDKRQQRKRLEGQSRYESLAGRRTY